MLNVSAKCLHFRFEFAEGQNTTMHAKYQISFQAQNAKISAVSTPILTGKAAFFVAFFALFQQNQWKTAENSRKRKKPSHKNSEHLEKSESFLCILVLVF